MTQKKFNNPLTMSSEEDLHLPEVGKPIERNLPTQTKKKERFEETHERFSAWVRTDLKKKFLELVEQRETTKTALLNEAIEGLLHKQDRKPYTKRQQLEAE